MKRKYVSKEEIVDLYINQNLTTSETQKRLGICRKVLYDYLKEYSIEKTQEQKYNARSKWTKIYNDKELKEKIQEFYVNQGLSANEVKSLLGISRAKLHNLTKELGYKRPAEVMLANMQKTCSEKYGLSFNCQSNKCREEQHKSKQEDEAYHLLVEKYGYIDVFRQHRTTEYPFPCDFYIKSLNLYIEFNPGPRHNGRPFNENRGEDIKELEFLKKKAEEVSDWYEGIIRTWSIRDPLKRKTARENNLNWIEFFSLKDLQEWLA